jgi:hypothetical protein
VLYDEKAGVALSITSMDGDTLIPVFTDEELAYIAIAELYEIMPIFEAGIELDAIEVDLDSECIPNNYIIIMIESEYDLNCMIDIMIQPDPIKLDIQSTIEED